MKDKTQDLADLKESKVTASILDAFDSLKASKDDEKITGGTRIVSQLKGSESDKDVQYTLKRLVRSLGANIAEIRTGYFATLVALLKKFDGITLSQLFDLAKKELHASSGSTKGEIGDVFLGQILVCGAAFRSGLLLRSSVEEQKEALELILTASKKKSYLGTAAYLILLDLIHGLDEDEFRNKIWVHIKHEFKKDVKEHSLDSLYVLLKVSQKFPESIKLKKLIGVSDILCEQNIHEVCEKIMGGIDFNTVSHPIYREIGTAIANSPHLQLFWISGIDSQLSKHNRNRELAALNILSNILTNIQDNFEVIPDLLSKNFFKLFMDWFKGLQTASKIRNKRSNEDDHKIMIKKEKELLNSLAEVLKSDKVSSKVRVEVLKKLLFNPGEMNFTEITGTSVIKTIIAVLDKASLKKMAKLFKGVLLNTSKKYIKEDVERGWYNNERVKAAELLSYLVSHEAVKDDTDFKLSHMKLLMCFGFFKIGGDDNVAVSGELAGAIKSCFYRCFTSRFSTVDNLVAVLSSLCEFVCSILQKEGIRAKMEKQFPKENMECWEMLTEICQAIEKNDAKSKVDNVFLILLYQLGLFLFSEPTHVKMARSSIKELKSCYEHYRKGKKNKLKKDLSDEPEWIEVLVEVLLSILSAESSVLRSIVQCVFRLLWEYLTPSSIGQIVSVIDPESEDSPLTQDSDSDDEQSGDEQKVDDSEQEDQSDGENDNDDSEVEEEDDEEMKTPEQLRIAVQKALGAVANDSDAESIDADMIDEEEGNKLDEALAEAFRQFHQGKGKKVKKDRKDKKALSDFRIKVLDLVDIYLEKDPSMDICLGMIAPLTRCLEFCLADNQFGELENRVRRTIKFLTKIRKFSSNDDVSIDILCDYLKANIDKGARSHFMFQAIGDIITCFATFIIYCSQKIETKTPQSPKKNKFTSPLVEIFKDAFQNYFRNRTCLLPIIFFHNVLQAEWEGSYELVPTVVDNTFYAEVRQFRRNEGLDLLAGFYRALRRNKPTSDKLLSKLSDIESSFEIKLTSAIQEDNFDVKNNFYVVLTKLLNTMKMFHESCHIESSIDFRALLEIVGKCKKNTKAKNKIKGKNENNQNGSTSTTEMKKRKVENLNGGPQSKKIKKSNQSKKQQRIVI